MNINGTAAEKSVFPLCAMLFSFFIFRCLIRMATWRVSYVCDISLLAYIPMFTVIGMPPLSDYGVWGLANYNISEGVRPKPKQKQRLKQQRQNDVVVTIDSGLCYFTMRFTNSVGRTTRSIYQLYHLIFVPIR